MQRIQDPSATATLPALPTLTGPVGYFTEGAPGTQAATDLRGWWHNMMQEELIGLLVAAGLATDGTQTVLGAVSIIGRRLLVITASTTWTVPADVSQVGILLCAGGGGGGCATTGAGGGGGGAGGTGRGFQAVTPGQTIAVTIGAGGAGGVSGGASAAAGGASSFGSYVSATGGLAGTNAPNSYASGGQGGGAAGAVLIIPGSWGTDGQAGSLTFPGNGGASFFGGGGRGGVGGGQTGLAWGSGGGGAYQTAGPGGAGAAGVCVLEY